MLPTPLTVDFRFSRDISNAKLDREEHAQIGYHTEGFCHENSEWLGILALQPTRIVTIELIFQPDKMGRDFQFSNYAWSAPADIEHLIPTRADPHALAQSRRPMDMMSQGWSMRRFQASQQ